MTQIKDIPDLLDAAYKENAALRERIGILGECLDLQSRNLNEFHNTNKRIDKLEELAKERAHLINYKSYLALGYRIEQLELFFSGKVKNPIYDAIELHIEKFNERLGFIDRALENYREYKTGIEDLETDVMYLKQQVKTTEELVSSMVSMPNVVWAKYNKTPHKCPVCEGTCMRPNPLRGLNNAEMPVNLDCIACEGAGILWA